MANGKRYVDGIYRARTCRLRDNFVLTQPFEIENAKDTLCRNVTIYGRCRYEDKGNLQFGISFNSKISFLRFDVNRILCFLNRLRF